VGFDTTRASQCAVVIGNLDLTKTISHHKVKPGDHIPVVIEGKLYDTIIDEHGVQRFPQSTINRYMSDHDSNGTLIDYGLPGAGAIIPMSNLNVLVRAYHLGKIEKRDWMEFVMQGYSVSGFLDLDEFRDWTIYNPLWDKGCAEIDTVSGTIGFRA
jgi:hypothetical protein